MDTSAYVRTLSSEELKIKFDELSKKVTDMSSVSCANTYLKEQCDKYGYDLSFRKTQQFEWCFFRADEEGPVLAVTKGRMNYFITPTGKEKWASSRQAAHRMIEKLSYDDLFELPYQPELYNEKLINLRKIYNREIQKRSPLHITSAVLEIAVAKNYKVEWHISKNETSFYGWGTIQRSIGKNMSRSAPQKSSRTHKKSNKTTQSFYPPIKTDVQSLPFCEDCKKKVKVLISQALLELLIK